MQKVALFVFNGDPMCFIHVLLNALDMDAKGYDCRVIVEGAATKLIAALAEQDHPLHMLWEKTKAAGLVEGVCKACSMAQDAATATREQGLDLLDEMNGHPSVTSFRDQGYDILIF